MKVIDDRIAQAFQALREEKAGRIEPDHLIRYVREHWPEDVEAARDVLLNSSLRGAAKRFMRRIFDEELNGDCEQLELLPRPIQPWITVPMSEGYVWVEYMSATLDDLRANYDLKETKRAQLLERMRADRANMDALTPYMETDPTMTVRQALEAIRKS